MEIGGDSKRYQTVGPESHYKGDREATDFYQQVYTEHPGTMVA